MWAAALAEPSWIYLYINVHTPNSSHLVSHSPLFAVAVAVAFFLCWAPFHAQRLMAVYGVSLINACRCRDAFNDYFHILDYTSGVLYFLSTCINPLLYNIMSHKFREAFKVCAANLGFLCFSLSERCKCVADHVDTSIRFSQKPSAAEPISSAQLQRTHAAAGLDAAAARQLQQQ